MTNLNDPNPDRSPYHLLGGETVVRAMVDAFYDTMDEDPDFYGIRKLHASSLDGARTKLFMFLCGWLGGPQLYVAQYGHPRLRARHSPFAIGISERDQWLACMARAMALVGVEPTLRAQLQASFMNTADWMRNKEG